jgi:hypothetical protein
VQSHPQQDFHVLPGGLYQVSPSRFMLFLGLVPLLHSSFQVLNDELNSFHFFSMQNNNPERKKNPTDKSS